MTTTARRLLAPIDASVTPTVRGLRSWGAVIVAAVLALVGILLDSWSSAGALDWKFQTLFYIGVILAVLAVRRGSIFTAMVQPPLVLAAGVLLGNLLLHHGSSSGKTLLIDLLVDVVKSFPIMAIGTAIAIVLGCARIILQPVRPRRRSQPAAASALHPGV